MTSNVAPNQRSHLPRLCLKKLVAYLGGSWLVWQGLNEIHKRDPVTNCHELVTESLRLSSGQVKIMPRYIIPSRYQKCHFSYPRLFSDTAASGDRCPCTAPVNAATSACPQLRQNDVRFPSSGSLRSRSSRSRSSTSQAPSGLGTHKSDKE